MQIFSQNEGVQLIFKGKLYSWIYGTFKLRMVLHCKFLTLALRKNEFYFLSGFLNTNISPGRKPSMANYGLMDQIAALKWVQENIRQFGGDPGKITLFGHNRGAACIHYLMQSPAVVPG